MRRLPQPCLIAVAALAFVSSGRAQTTTRESVSFNSVEFPIGCNPESAVSLDGRYVVFAPPIQIGPQYVLQVLLRDRVAGVDLLVSAAQDGSFGDNWSFRPTMTPDQRWVAFNSVADNLVPEQTGNFETVLLRDMQSNVITWESPGLGGSALNGNCSRPGISRDGRFVVFSSEANNLVAGDTNGREDVFVRDRQAQTMERASLGLGGQASQDCISASISDDGRFVVFESFSSNLVAGDTNGTVDVFVRDLVLQTTSAVDLNASHVLAPLGAESPRISGDGRFVVFFSDDGSLMLGDTNGDYDGFIRELATGTVELLSAKSTGGFAGGTWRESAISQDGRFVAFVSQSPELVPVDLNGKEDVFLRDRLLGTTERVNVRTDGTEAPPYIYTITFDPALSDDGRFITYGEDASLATGDVNTFRDVYLRDRQGVGTTIESYCTAKVNSAGATPVIGASGLPSVSGANAFVLTAIRVLPNKNGLFFWGLAPASLSFGGGTLCVQPPIVRSPVQTSSTGPSGVGSYFFPFDASYMSAFGLSAGESIYGQFWSRDPGFAPPDNIGLTDAILFTLAP